MSDGEYDLWGGEFSDDVEDGEDEDGDVESWFLVNYVGELFF